MRVGMKYKNLDTGFCEVGSVLLWRTTDFDFDQLHAWLTNDFEVQFLQNSSACDLAEPVDSDYIDNY